MSEEPHSREHYDKRGLEVLELRFVQGWNLYELAAHYDLSVERIRQIITRMRLWGQMRNPHPGDGNTP